MPGELMLTPEESEVIEGFVVDGPSTINDDNVDELTFALLKTSADTFNKAMTILSSEAKLRRDIITQLGKTSISAITSNDVTTRKEIDNDRANSDAIRNILNTSGDNPEIFRMCLTELRMYSQKIAAANEKAQAFQMQVLEKQADTIEEVTPKSSAWKEVVAGIVGAAAGGAAAGYIGYRVGKSKGSQPANLPPVKGKIK